MLSPRIGPQLYLAFSDAALVEAEIKTIQQNCTKSEICSFRTVWEQLCYIGPAAVRYFIVVWNCALISALMVLFYFFQTSAILAGLVSQADLNWVPVCAHANHWVVFACPYTVIFFKVVLHLVALL